MALILKYYRKSIDKYGDEQWEEKQILNIEAFVELQSALKNKEISFIFKDNEKDKILYVDFHLKNGDYISIS